MKIKYWFIFASIIFVILSFVSLSCKKDDENQIIVKGSITDPKTGSGIAGCSVYLDGKILSSGVYNDNFSEIASATTDGSGQFEIKTDWQVVSQYRIRAFKLNYFENSSLVSAESIPKGGTYSTTINISPVAWVRLNVTNIVGFNNDDQIQYKFASTPQTCFDCCGNQFIVGDGATYSSTMKCKVIGNRYNKFYWTVRRNGDTNPFSDSIFCPSFDTTVKVINY
jgi:hypothetical protein